MGAHLVRLADRARTARRTPPATGRAHSRAVRRPRADSSESRDRRRGRAGSKNETRRSAILARARRRSVGFWRVRQDDGRAGDGPIGGHRSWRRTGSAARPDDGEQLRRFLERIRAGDEEAARELLGRYEAEVRLVVRRQLPRLMRSRFDSLDFLQSVWGSFFRRVRGGRGPADFEDSRHLVAFLARAAKNKVIDEYRRAGSQKQDMHREEPLWVDGHRPRELAGHRRLAQRGRPGPRGARPISRPVARGPPRDRRAEGPGALQPRRRRAARHQRADRAAGHRGPRRRIDAELEPSRDATTLSRGAEATGLRGPALDCRAAARMTRSHAARRPWPSPSGRTWDDASSPAAARLVRRFEADWRAPPAAAAPTRPPTCPTTPRPPRRLARPAPRRDGPALGGRRAVRRRAATGPLPGPRRADPGRAALRGVLPPRGGRRRPRPGRVRPALPEPGQLAEPGPGHPRAGRRPLQRDPRRRGPPRPPGPAASRPSRPTPPAPSPSPRPARRSAASGWSRSSAGARSPGSSWPASGCWPTGRWR